MLQKLYTRIVLRRCLPNQFVEHFRRAVGACHLLVQSASGGGDCLFAMSRQNSDFGRFELRFNQETNAELLLAEFIDGREMPGKAIALAVNHRLEELPLVLRRQFRSSASLA